jgi:hypothetical protein
MLLRCSEALASHCRYAASNLFCYCGAWYMCLLWLTCLLGVTCWKRNVLVLCCVAHPQSAVCPLPQPADALEDDSKNYHAWAHRQMVVAAAGAWQQEMEYLEGLLQQDVRNNSAWNQRAFVIRVSKHSCSSTAGLRLL